MWPQWRWHQDEVMGVERTEEQRAGEVDKEEDGADGKDVWPNVGTLLKRRCLLLHVHVAWVEADADVPTEDHPRHRHGDLGAWRSKRMREGGAS